MKKTDQATSTRPIVKPSSRPSSRNQVLPPLTPEEQSKRTQPQTIKDLTGFSTDQLLKKGQKSGTVRLKKLDYQPKPRNSADVSKENELPSTSSASTSASKRKPLPKTNKNWWTSSSTDQFEAGSENSSFSVEPEENQVGINITKALKTQKESGELEKFLKECGLPQYTEAFREHGFDDLDTIMEIQVKHLVDMRIPAGHQVKISRRIEQIREPQNNSIKNCLSERGDSNLAKINMSQINSSREGYSGRIEVTEPDKDEAIGDDKAGKSLLDGAFNEEESHASFLEALNEWRNRKPVQQVKAEPVKAEPPKRILRRVKSKEPKSVRFADSKKEEEEEEGEDVDYISFKPAGAEKKPFFFSAGGESWNVVEMPTQVESGTDARRPAQPKVSCWNCYKLTSEKESKKVEERVFCSDDCVKTFKEQNSIACSKRGCKKRFMKEEGVLREGSWFCGDKCAPVGDRRSERGRGASNRGVSQGEDVSDGEGMEAFELSVDFGNKKVMSMAQLEEKYQSHMVESG